MDYCIPVPYEIMQSDAMSYEDLLMVKDVEHLVELYYNSKRFSTVCPCQSPVGLSLCLFGTSPSIGGAKLLLRTQDAQAVRYLSRFFPQKAAHCD